jgi:nitrous oxide reductase accessory protein NosL
VPVSSSAFDDPHVIIEKQNPHPYTNMKLRTLLTTAFLGLTLAACTTPEPALAAEKAKPYPLKTCLVSGNDLDSMGGPITKVYDNGQEIKFCCKPCIKKFEANPGKYLGKLPK